LQDLLEVIRKEYEDRWGILVESVSAAAKGKHVDSVLDVIEAWLGGHNLLDDEGVAIAAALVVGWGDFVAKTPDMAGLCSMAFLRPHVPIALHPIPLDLHYLVGGGLRGVKYRADLDKDEAEMIADATAKIRAAFAEFRRRAAESGIQPTPVPVNFARDCVWAAAYLVERLSYEALAERFDMNESVVKRAVGAILERCGLRPRRRGKPRKAPAIVVRKGAKSRI
jgi:hypothetical protein